MFKGRFTATLKQGKPIQNIYYGNFQHEYSVEDTFTFEKNDDSIIIPERGIKASFNVGNKSMPRIVTISVSRFYLAHLADIGEELKRIVFCVGGYGFDLCVTFSNGTPYEKGLSLEMYDTMSDFEEGSINYKVFEPIQGSFKLTED